MASPATNSLERVSVVIPCYNEERFIGAALDNLAAQYNPEWYEIIVIDGNSEDGTRDVIRQFIDRHPNISVLILDNPARNIPTALNIGVKAAKGEVIARMDAHAVPCPGYIERCVTVLKQEGVGVVGMPCRVCPGSETAMASAIAAAVSHPFGIGDAKYRLGAGGAPQEPVDTVAFSCFRKSLWEHLGGFNEDLLTNEDYDFNYRVRQTGQQVLLDRWGHCDYFARSTLSGLAKQYSRYGSWKARMVRMHPRSIRLRHVVAPLFVASVLILGLVGIFWPLAWALLGLELLVYFLTAFWFGSQISRKSSKGTAIWLIVPVAFFVIHWTWGSSFWFGLVHSPSR